MSDRRISFPLHLVLRWILTITLVALLTHYHVATFNVTGDIKGFVIVGSLLTLLNVVARPILYILTFPLRIVATIAAIVLANWAFLWIVREITLKFDPTIVTVALPQTNQNWLLLAMILGIANWMMKPGR